MAGSTATERRTKHRSDTAKKPTKKPKKAQLTARTADKHQLYQESVQAPEYDAKTYARWFKKYTGRELRVLREDFCGTAILACHHVLRHPENRAIGVDLDGPTLAWGREHNVAPLLDAEQQKRLLLLQKNVLDVQTPKADAILALNFSYSVFQKRHELLAYVRNSFRSLKPGGVLYMDAWGGPDVIQQKTDRSRKKGFHYLWEQRSFDPISHRILCAIHFEFPDGTRMRNAFVYDWRLWSIAELRELMDEAGFEDVHVLWEGTDPATRGGNGIFRRKEIGDMDECWISFVVGRKPS